VTRTRPSTIDDTRHQAPPPRQTPHNLEAEESVLGAMLLTPQAIDDAVGAGLYAEHFYAPRHQHICAAIFTLVEADQPVDPVTVADQLRQQGLYDTIGGAVTLLNLQAGAPTTTNAAHYTHIILRDAEARRVIAAATELIDNAYAGLPLDTSALTGHPRADVTPLTQRPVHQLLANPPQRKPHIVEGLLRPGELIGLAAARGIGKSWALMDLAASIADGRGRWLDRFWIQPTDRPVLYWHGEMDDEGAYERWTLLVGKGTVSPRLIEFDQPWRVRVAKVTRTERGERHEETRAILDPRVVDLLEQLRPSVFFIDPWRAAYGGTENDNDAMDAALAQLLTVARHTGTAIVIAHHFGKGDVTTRIDVEDAWRGASVLADRVHTRITFLPHYTSPAKANTAALKAGITDPTKARHWARHHVDATFLRRTSASPDGMSLRWDQTDGRWHHWTPDPPDPAEQRRLPADAAIAIAIDTLIEAARTARDKKGDPINGFLSARHADQLCGLGQWRTKQALDIAVERRMLTEEPGETPRSPKRYALTNDYRTPE
jgi:hypothetical protein